ncbi:hypothetical protein [Spirulina major]|uniref:hypothetical protein n=1 Tax=Spirulina major TaxID=270636 RepID=UPI001114BCC3|nr:hypothetical protein [Spirulina major]
MNYTRDTLQSDFKQLQQVLSETLAHIQASTPPGTEAESQHIQAQIRAALTLIDQLPNLSPLTSDPNPRSFVTD